MKKIISLFVVISISLLSLSSCKSAEEHYIDKAIYVKVSHINCFDVYDEYDIYFDNIKRGERYDLPNGEANPSYKVEFTITNITKECLTITFSQPMDKINDENSKAWELGQSSFDLRQGDSQRFVTPTDGGGDVFIFTIIDKADIQTNK